MICSIFLDLGSLYAVLMMVSNEYIRLVGVPGFHLDSQPFTRRCLVTDQIGPCQIKQTGGSLSKEIQERLLHKKKIIKILRPEDQTCSRKKSRFLQLFLRILSSLKIFKSCQSKSIYLLNWTQLISADLSFHILGILLNVNLGGFGFNVSFSKRAVQMLVRNIG